MSKLLILLFALLSCCLAQAIEIDAYDITQDWIPADIIDAVNSPSGDDVEWSSGGEESRDVIPNQVCLYESFDDLSPCGGFTVTPNKRTPIFGGAAELWLPLAGNLNQYDDPLCNHFFGGCNANSGPAFTGIRVACEVVTNPCNIVIDFESPQIGTFTIGKVLAQVTRVVNITPFLNGTRVGGNISFVASNTCNAATLNAAVTPTSAFDRIVIQGVAVEIDDITFCSSACVNAFTGGSDERSCLPVTQDTCLHCTDGLGIPHYSKVTCDAECGSCQQKIYLDSSCKIKLLTLPLLGLFQCDDLASIFPVANTTCFYSKIV